MPRPVLEQALELWGPRLVQYYGQTEAPLAITVLDAADHTDPALAGSCGQPSVDAEVRVTAADGTPLRHRRGRRAAGARPFAHGRLPRRARADRRDASTPTAGCAPATWPASTTAAT